jgi:protein O-GlcNAc transferase
MLEITIEQAMNLALQHHQAGRLAEAETIYRQILALQPNEPDAMHFLGVLANQTGKPQVGVELIGRAIALRPGVPEYHNNIGVALMELARFDEAINHYRTALHIRPTYAEAHNNLGNALRENGQPEAAIAEFQTAIHFKPENPEPYNNLGNVLKDQNRLDEAVVAYQRSVKVKPDYAPAYNNLGNVFKDQGRLGEALAAYHTAVGLKPDSAQIHSNLIYGSVFHPGYDAKTIREEHVRWNKQHAEPLKKFIHPQDGSDSCRDDPERRLKIGYVSPDFYSHAESCFVAPLLKSHDHQQFEIHCYASVVRPDQITDRIRGYADVWHDVLRKSDPDLADQIRRDQIDILVDLTMHMAYNRLLVFARKPAPLQVTWLAHPGSTGLNTIDYRLTDAFLDPPGVPTPYFTEEAVYLPDCWCCYDPLSGAAPKPPRQEGLICFGSLNNPCKLNDQILNLWSKVLAATRDSRLLMLAFSAEHQNHIRTVFERAGIGVARLIFVKRCPRDEYLRLYDRIDIVLDPLPYNGITTTLDALWMGVPVISLAGNAPPGRVGLGILTTLGMPELAAHSQEQFVQIASALAGDLPRLVQLRKTLRQRLRASPLMDAPRFARNIEAAYRDMWRKWVAKSMRRG